MSKYIHSIFRQHHNLFLWFSAWGCENYSFTKDENGTNILIGFEYWWQCESYVERLIIAVAVSGSNSNTSTCCSEKVAQKVIGDIDKNKR